MALPEGTERIVYFGDSLTDNGNFFELSGRILTLALPLQSAGYSGAFTNGQVYADTAADLLGLRSENFAVGSAEALGDTTMGELLGANPLVSLFLQDEPDPEALATEIDLVGQVDRFLSDGIVAGSTEPGTVASFLIGLNDLSGFEPGNPLTAAAEVTELIADIAVTVTEQAVRLAEAGVEAIVWNRVPFGSLFPAIELADPVVRGLADLATSGLNRAVEMGLEQVEALGVPVEIVDLNALSVQIAADPEAFGLATLDTPILIGTGGNPQIADPTDPEPFFPPNPDAAGLTPDQTGFFDLLHPTGALHDIWGAFQAASLGGETLTLGNEADDRAGTSGDDMVIAARGDDTVRLGAGDDTLLAGFGADVGLGGAGADVMLGGAGDDRLIGASGFDVLAGNDGDDVLAGGSEGDVLIGGRGSDLVIGAGGADVLVWQDPAFLAVPGEDVATLPDGRIDLYLGGTGEDTLLLQLTPETRAAVEAELSTQDVGLGVVILPSIGLHARGIEHVEIRTGRDDVVLDDVSGVVQDRLDLADLWGAI